MIDINLEESKATLEKIIINSKTRNPENNFTTIKCYQSFPKKTSLEVRGVNIIKIHKTVYLNIPNLIYIDLRDNKLLKISKNFKLFKNLISFRLDNNQIMFIPSFISEFSHLEEFTISNNNLTAIPASIQYLTSLKIFKFSRNKISKLPIEFGLLSSLKCLHIDANYYTEIPTTLCYLQHLEEFSFEWLEFLDPPFYKTLKDAMGKACISMIRTSLQEMVKNSILYCDFQTFIDKISSNKQNGSKNYFTQTENLPTLNAINNALPNKNMLIINGENNSKLLKIFTAIENNYYGVVKSQLDISNEFLNVKNTENKTPFYIAIHNRDDDMINLFLSKIDLSKFPSSHVYFHKAIRTRNSELVKKMVNMGININSIDDQGNGCFHILFAVFTKQLSRCALIGDFLLEKGGYLNTFNNDNLAPVHTAAKRGSKECLYWILSSNRKRKKEGKELFDLNLIGKNKWTPLHFTVSSYRLEESLILLENGCNVFARNIDKNTPKRVTNGNSLFTKLLTHYENIILANRYKEKECEENAKIRCLTSVDGDGDGDGDEDEDENEKSKRKMAEIKKHSKTNNLLSINNIPHFQKVKFIEKKNTLSSIIKVKEMSNEKRIIRKYSSQSSNFLNLQTINRLESFGENPLISAYGENDIITSNNNSNINKDEKEEEENEVSNTSKENSESEKVNNIIDILQSSDNSLFEKYQSFNFIRLNKKNITAYIKKIIDKIELENNTNLILLSDICNYSTTNSITELLSVFSQLLNNIAEIKTSPYIIKEIKNTINILEKFKNSKFDKLPQFARPLPKDKHSDINQNKQSKQQDNMEEMFNHGNNTDDDLEDRISEHSEGNSDMHLIEDFKKRDILKLYNSMDLDHPMSFVKKEGLPNNQM